MAGVFVCMVAATLTISAASPIFRWIYCLCVLAIALPLVLRETWPIPVSRRHYAIQMPMRAVRLVILGVIAAWGFVQLALAESEYAYATRARSVECTAMAAVAVVMAATTKDNRLCDAFLRATAVVGFLTSVVSVLAYFTSIGKILWFFESPYPDTWGPFLSRNDFAVFLELTFPVALWLGFEKPARTSSMRNAYLWMGAWMYAAGLASASRAGALLLTAEAAILLWTATRKRRAYFLGAAFAFIAIAGAGTLLDRLSVSDPLQYRREIAAATVEMIGDRPWQGFGLGTFPQIYPSYAHFDAGALVNHAHNDWLEWCVEGGIPFALIWLALMFTAVPGAIRSKWGLGIGAVFLHALVDYPFAKPGLAAWAFALIGTLGADEMRKVGVRVH